ncbi:hypothetical protein TNCV_3596571 [Trichonephila clavipes]|nr:hypothetical protein TNCV_3596571 [Trichonephila clavipes]
MCVEWGSTRKLCSSRGSTKTLFSYTRAFGDGPRNFEPWLSDVDDTIAGITFPKYHINGRTFELSTDLAFLAALHGGSLVVLGSNSRQSQQRSDTLTTRLPRLRVLLECIHRRGRSNDEIRFLKVIYSGSRIIYYLLQ